MPAQSYENIAAYRDFLEERSAAAAKGAPPMTAGVRAEMERLRTSANLEARQNDETVKKLHGTEVMYGQAVQLLHVRSGKYLTARSRRLSATEKECTLLELDMDGDEHSLFNLLPRYKHRRCVRSSCCATPSPLLACINADPGASTLDRAIPAPTSLPTTTVRATRFT